MEGGTVSSYTITIHCPKCGTQSGVAEDDAFGMHSYGYRCDKCQSLYRETDVDTKDHYADGTHVFIKALDDITQQERADATYAALRFYLRDQLAWDRTFPKDNGAWLERRIEVVKKMIAELEARKGQGE